MLKDYLLVSYIFIFLVAPFSIYTKGYAIDTIIIDPGHGGTDPGAINKENKSLMEKNINLDISKNLMSIVKEKLPNVKIVTTRNADYFVSLGERSKIANQYMDKNTLFISIHTNSHLHNRKVEGVEVFYHYTSNSTIANFRMGEYRQRYIGKLDNNELNGIKVPLSSILNTKVKEDSKDLAKYIADGIHLASKEPIRQVSPSNLYVVSYSVVPSVLVEVGFISNDKLKNKKYLERLAKGIFLGILSYIKEKKYN